MKRPKSKLMEIPINPRLLPRAKELRKAGNLAEVLLWKELKKGGINGLDFDRQKVVGNYIVDFICLEKMVVIEIDGGSHNQKVEYDKKRDAFLIGLGMEVIHISDFDVKKRMDAVLRMLKGHEKLQRTEE